MCVCVYVCVSHSVVSDFLQPHGLQPAPWSMEFSRQEYWSGLPFPSPGDFPGIEPRCPALQGDSLPFEPPGKPSSVNCIHISILFQIISPYRLIQNIE